MDPIVLILGLVVLAAVTLDFLAVTVGATMRATLTGHVGHLVFMGMRAAARWGGEALFTRVSGVVVMSAVATVWIVGTWVGWSLIYGSFAGSLAMGPTGVEPEAPDFAAHTGHLLSTLGGARTAPSAAPWGIVGVLVGVNGMVVLTASVSFLLSVRQTVQAGRAFATLQDLEALDPAEDLPRLAELVAGLHAAPFALWYAAPRLDRQLPAAILGFARDSHARGGTAWRRVEVVLRDLPHLPQRDGPLLPVLAAWAQAHTIQRMDEGEVRAADA
ncbi:hypothetical protein JQC91_00955 [Jannaschia sp. Os4]|uniref:hypothetical protein n=1 Tax=Jannaschia sp. Os4 TaxID=2807617 RepID=UPI00193A6585|nr:hypothetical protein [Jannaschia sp. Os4]MBM2574860.1 hypothetical protein [Jannaschia sp. Os4]